MQARGYATRLVRGSESADEGNMDDLARRMGVTPTLVASMRRDPGPGDVRALAQLVRILRRDRPALVHTHAAKGGTLGRVAVMLAFPRRRPAVVHTFHGHSLTGYFPSRTARMYTRIERFLARRTNVLVAVSEEVRDDLVGLGVAPPGQFEVVRLGLDLSAFADDADRAARRGAVRAQWGAGDGDDVVTLVARLVPIKRVDRFLETAALLRDRPSTRFVIVGDGELREELQSSEPARALGDRLIWAGFRRDMADVCFASDVVVLTSDNEGTPVSLIEASACSVAVVGTDVGGVRSVVVDGATGYVVPPDVTAVAERLRALLADPELRTRFGTAGRERVAGRFGADRLATDHDRLYRALLAG